MCKTDYQPKNQFTADFFQLYIFRYMVLNLINTNKVLNIVNKEMFPPRFNYIQYTFIPFITTLLFSIYSQGLNYFLPISLVSHGDIFLWYYYLLSIFYNQNQLFLNMSIFFNMSIHILYNNTHS